MILITVKLETSSGTQKDGSPWTRYKYTFQDGKSASTFDPDIIKMVVIGQPYDWTLEPKGKYVNILEVKPAPPNGKPETVAPEQPVAYQENGTEVSQDIWEAKDRRIAMESAYGSAARFLSGPTGVGSDKETLVNLARLIYSDIQRAGKGETLGPVKAAKVSSPTRQELPEDELPF